MENKVVDLKTLSTKVGLNKIDCLVFKICNSFDYIFFVTKPYRLWNPSMCIATHVLLLFIIESIADSIVLKLQYINNK